MMVLKNQQTGDGRSSAPAHAAAVLLAVLAVTMVAANGQSATLRTGEVRQAMREADPAGVVAAAVKAAARDLLGAEQLQTAGFQPVCVYADASRYEGSIRRVDDRIIPAPQPLDERLLDLPPPTC